MADVREGLAGGVDSDAGFTAALARQAGVEIPEGQLEELESQDRTIAAGLTTEESPRPRDDSGRFAKREPESEAQEGAAPVEEERTDADPDLSAFLEQHGGDSQAALAAALKEAREAQSLIGRQSAEVNEARQLRERMARLEGMLETRDAAPQAPPAAPPVVDDNTIAGLEQLYDQHGPNKMIEWVASNRPDLLDAAEEVWHSYDPLNAARYAARRAALEAQFSAQSAAPQPDNRVADLLRERQMGEMIAQVRQATPAGEWTLVKEHIIPTFQDAATPDVIKNMIVSDDPATQKQGLDVLVQLAKARVVAQATSQAGAEREAANSEAKRAAQVATGSLRPAQERQPAGQGTREERIKSFQEMILGAETTSVRDGLTYGSR